jgi:hypothetical protein
MILEIYLSLLALSMIFVFLGFQLENKVDAFKFMGFILLFILGLMLIPLNPFGSMEYNSGSNITLNGNSTIVQDTYTTYENLRVGIYLGTLGALGFVSSFFLRKSEEGEDDG